MPKFNKEQLIQEYRNYNFLLSDTSSLSSPSDSENQQTDNNKASPLANLIGQFSPEWDIDFEILIQILSQQNGEISIEHFPKDWLENNKFKTEKQFFFLQLIFAYDELFEKFNAELLISLCNSYQEVKSYISTNKRCLQKIELSLNPEIAYHEKIAMELQAELQKNYPPISWFLWLGAAIRVLFLSILSKNVPFSLKPSYSATYKKYPPEAAKAAKGLVMAPIPDENSATSPSPQNIKQQDTNQEEAITWKNRAELGIEDFIKYSSEKILTTNQLSGNFQTVKGFCSNQEAWQRITTGTYTVYSFPIGSIPYTHQLSPQKLKIFHRQLAELSPLYNLKLMSEQAGYDELLYETILKNAEIWKEKGYIELLISEEMAPSQDAGQQDLLLVTEESIKNNKTPLKDSLTPKSFGIDQAFRSQAHSGKIYNSPYLVLLHKLFINRPEEHYQKLYKEILGQIDLHEAKKYLSLPMFQKISNIEIKKKIYHNLGTLLDKKYQNITSLSINDDDIFHFALLGHPAINLGNINVLFNNKTKAQTIHDFPFLTLLYLFKSDDFSKEKQSVINGVFKTHFSTILNLFNHPNISIIFNDEPTRKNFVFNFNATIARSNDLTIKNEIDAIMCLKSFAGNFDENFNTILNKNLGIFYKILMSDKLNENEKQALKTSLERTVNTKENLESIQFTNDADIRAFFLLCNKDNLSSSKKFIANLYDTHKTKKTLKDLPTLALLYLVIVIIENPISNEDLIKLAPEAVCPHLGNLYQFILSDEFTTRLTPNATKLAHQWLSETVTGYPGEIKFNTDEDVYAFSQLCHISSATTEAARIQQEVDEAIKDKAIQNFPYLLVIYLALKLNKPQTTIELSEEAEDLNYIDFKPSHITIGMSVASKLLEESEKRNKVRSSTTADTSSTYTFLKEEQIKQVTTWKKSTTTDKITLLLTQ